MDTAQRVEQRLVQHVVVVVTVRTHPTTPTRPTHHLTPRQRTTREAVVASAGPAEAVSRVGPQRVHLFIIPLPRFAR